MRPSSCRRRAQGMHAGSDAPARARPPMEWIGPGPLSALFLAGAGIVYVGIAGLAGSSSLGAGAVVVEARVTGARTVTHSKRGKTYEVQYAFPVGGQTYTSRDPTGRTNLWVSLTQE